MKDSEQALIFYSLLYRCDLCSLTRLPPELVGHGDFLFYHFPAHGLAAYYAEEMKGAAQLKRCLLLELRRSSKFALLARKKAALAREAQHRCGGARTVNIDPGYVALDQVVLSSVKPYAHRTPLGEGLYSELELRFQARQFSPLPWTYPDYASCELRAFFSWARGLLRAT